MGGNETLKKIVNGIKINVTISYWRCLEKELSFHLKIVASKSFFNSVIFDKSLFGERFIKSKTEKKIADIPNVSVGIQN